MGTLSADIWSEGTPSSWNGLLKPYVQHSISHKQSDGLDIPLDLPVAARRTPDDPRPAVAAKHIAIERAAASPLCVLCGYLCS